MTSLSVYMTPICTIRCACVLSAWCASQTRLLVCAFFVHMCVSLDQTVHDAISSRGYEDFLFITSVYFILDTLSRLTGQVCICVGVMCVYANRVGNLGTGDCEHDRRSESESRSWTCTCVYLGGRHEMKV